MMSLIGTWVAAFLTLCVFSFLYRDNPFYKIAEHLVVGVSVGYGVVIGLQQTLKPYVINPLKNPDVALFDKFVVVIAVLLGILYFSRFSNKYSWMSRWPIAFSMGTVGLSIVTSMQASILVQLRNTMNPLFVMAGGGVDWGASINAILVFVGVLTVFSYFFFSVEHKGGLRYSAGLGQWFLMISFGASFGLTVMGRISLLIGRLVFLYSDWLGFIQ